MSYFHRFKITGPALRRSWAPYVWFYTVIQVQYIAPLRIHDCMLVSLFFIFKYVQTFLKIGRFKWVGLKKNVSNKPII